MTLAQGLAIGPAFLPVIRILIIIGFLRIMIRREWMAGGLNAMDFVMLAWGFWVIACSVFHRDPNQAFIYGCGAFLSVLGVYFLIRVFFHSLDDISTLSRMIALLLVPVAIEMAMEHVTGRNFFSLLGGVSETPLIRDGRLRAQGPFAHSILAGTVGATCFPLMIGLWRHHRMHALIGAGACGAMVLASSSSGPIMSTVAAVGAIFLWRYRHLMTVLRWAALFGYIGLDIVMKAPAYYILARIDLTGSSTGWHRARLIESAFQHLSEWWWAGTDYTRHWMPSGVSWSAEHTDITNYYLKMGVIGGLPLMLLFLASFLLAFAYVGRIMRCRIGSTLHMQFMVWTLGSSLFAHATTCISVSYFDQSYLFLYLGIAAVSSLYSWSLALERSGGSLIVAPDVPDNLKATAVVPLPSRYPGYSSR